LLATALIASNASPYVRQASISGMVLILVAFNADFVLMLATT
jgi:hypothetical protein